MHEVNTELSEEFTIHIVAGYSPGRPATPPSYDSGGDPPEPDEWELRKITDVTYREGTLTYDASGKPQFSYQDRSLVANMSEADRGEFLRLLDIALVHSSLRETIAENVAIEFWNT